MKIEKGLKKNRLRENNHDDKDDDDDGDDNDDDDDDDVKAFFYDETESSASVLPHWIKERCCRRRCLRLKLTQF